MEDGDDTTNADDPIGAVVVPLEQGIAGAVARSGRPLMVPDVSQCDFYSPESDSREGIVARSALCVPVLDAHNKGQVLGVLHFVNKRSPGAGKSNGSNPWGLLDHLTPRHSSRGGTKSPGLLDSPAGLASSEEKRDYFNIDIRYIVI